MTNKEAIEHLKSIIEFYKVGDPDNFDYTDKHLISIKIVLDILDKAIELLENADYWDDIGNELLPILRGEE